MFRAEVVSIHILLSATIYINNNNKKKLYRVKPPGPARKDQTMKLQKVHVSPPGPSAPLAYYGLIRFIKKWIIDI